ncbi:hypothetical protein LUZ63_000264 [Rhynchospora breviuscula]|uniref:Aminotransferase-like plant mobile domain-containing protein n=1 Tax=Rhynchospora breviuscula TaxID=2022672 RepID=A0A9Q0HWG8_9POAL|nr:hypothetical protein LUZ63_000264 [Rhynchospora breviuscula]
MCSAQDEAGPSGSSPPPTEGPSQPASQARARRRRRRTALPNPYNVNPVERQSIEENQQVLFLADHEHIEGRLMKLGLIYISKVKHVNIDMSLLKAMVEFWSPETHTFHFPVEEMTVTLKDVAFIYGLRIEGIPVRGNTKGSWEEKIRAQLFPHANLENWARETSELRENCGRVPAPGASDDELDRYTRAVAVELFGMLMFPDISQNSVPAYYLELVSGNLNEVPEFNWRGATLESLYRALDRAAMCFKTVTGPWMMKWGEARSFLGSHHRGAVENARDQIAVLDMEDVNWYPYVQDQALMPRKPTPREEAESRIRRKDRLQISQRQYTHMGSRLRNTGNSALKNALHALGLVVKKGCRRVGKAILTNCLAQLENASMPFRMEDLLEKQGLATKIEEIPDFGDESSSGHPTVPTNLQA